MEYFPYKYEHYDSAADYAEQNRLIKGAPFTYTLTPFFKEITKAASDTIHNAGVVVMCPAQLGKTTLIENLINYYANVAPENSLLIADTDKSAKKLARRLKSFMNNEEIASDVKGRSNSVSQLQLNASSSLFIGHSKSASDLCSTPVKYLFCDELDRWAYEIRGEGDPIQLARKRTMRFRGMFCLTSTPTLYTGRIMTEYLLGTQERYAVKCECGNDLFCEFDTLSMLDNGEIVTTCDKCGQTYTEKEIINKPHYFTPPKSGVTLDKYGRVTRSFSITGALCHNFYAWDALYSEFVENRKRGETALRTFYNTSCGEVYEPKVQSNINFADLELLAEFPETLPGKFEYIVGGVDTHDNGFYCVKYGVKDSKFYGISYQFINGDLTLASVWDTLREVTKDCKIVCIDSGGHFTSNVYAFCMTNKNFVPIKGSNEYSTNKGQSFLKSYHAVRVDTVGSGRGQVRLLMTRVNEVKDLIHTELQNLLVGKDAVLHFPKDNGFNMAFYQGLCSETPHDTPKGRIWVNDTPFRNEPLDCTVYAIAANLLLTDKQARLAAIESRRK